MHTNYKFNQYSFTSMRYFIRLSYNGTGFCGWQIQPNGITVQESLERALSLALGTGIKVTGAGRTDTAVNAVNYIAHFDAEDTLIPEPGALGYKLNAILGKGIIVHEIARADDDFHARFSATSREYRYFIHRKKDPFMWNFSWFCKFGLDMDMMNSAALFLKGTHDFSCFEKKGGNNRTSVCTVYEAGWKTYIPGHATLLGYPCEDGDYLVFTVRADRFLRNMVRAMVGSLVEVGRGKHDPEWIRQLIEGGIRSDAGESVPAHALFLNKVEYWHRD